MLKRKITEPEFNALKDNAKEFYVKIGSNYLLNLDDQDDDAGELRRAHEAVKAENRDLKTKNTELNAVNVTLRGEVDAAVALANSDNKVKEIKDKHKAEIDSLNLANETKLAKTVELIRKTARDNVVNGMANEISLYPQLLRSVIADRVSVELDDDYRPTIIVLDKDAKPSKMTVDDLKTEFRSSEELKAVQELRRAGSIARLPGNPAIQLVHPVQHSISFRWPMLWPGCVMSGPLKIPSNPELNYVACE
jgi:hypothetical protein